MSSAIKTKISEIMKSAMKSQDKDTLAFARNIFSVVRKKEIDDRKDVTDEEIVKIAQNLMKQRRESIEMFKKGNRDDLVKKEEAELHFLEQFQPPQMDDTKLEAVVVACIAETGATNAKDMGKVMKAVIAKTQGQADGKRVSELVKKKLPA